MFKKDDIVCLKETPSVFGRVSAVYPDTGSCRVLWVQSASVELMQKLRPYVPTTPKES